MLKSLPASQRLTRKIFAALEETGEAALIGKGWGNLGVIEVRCTADASAHRAVQDVGTAAVQKPLLLRVSAGLDMCSKQLEI